MAVKCTSVGPCGLFCGSCPIYLAGFYPELRVKLARELHCSEEDIKCNGCRELSDSCWGMHCKIKLCAENRGHEYCSECEQRPCEKLSKLSMGYHDLPQQQLDELMKLGRDEFMALLEKRWTCSCGLPISAYTQKCIKCQEDSSELVPQA